MKSTSEIGMNKTGIQTSPKLTEEMLKGAEMFSPDAAPHQEGLRGIEGIRRPYMEAADPIGTVPPPGTMKGVLKTGVQAMKGNDPTIFLDKLGERLAFERTGVRIYDSLIMKCQVQEPNADIDQLKRIRHEEAQHFAMLVGFIEKMGADPTAQTPSADAVAVMSMGLVQAINDPRATIDHAIQVVHAAELIDVDGWEMLIQLANEAGQSEMVEKFRQAAAAEQQHLDYVRQWHQQLLLNKQPAPIQ